jgi:hypothetical protein
MREPDPDHPVEHSASLFSSMKHLPPLVAEHRERELDAAYAAYDSHPLDEQDEWGDLASREARCGGAKSPTAAPPGRRAVA